MFEEDGQKPEGGGVKFRAGDPVGVVGRESGLVQSLDDRGEEVHVFIARLVFHFEQEGLAEGGRRDVLDVVEPVEGFGPVVGGGAVERVVRCEKERSS